MYNNISRCVESVLDVRMTDIMWRGMG